MTEHEWLTGSDPRFGLELAHVQDRLGPRRERLIAVALCRTHLKYLDDAELWALLDTAEEYADGRAARDDLDRARQSARERAVKADAAAERVAADPDAHRTEVVRCAIAWAVSFAAAPVVYLASAAQRLEAAVRHAHGEHTGFVTSPALDAALGEHREAMRPLLRDVAGNPFRPVALAPDWRSDTAVSLARVMYESRDFSAMPILADALQDAGCEDELVLNHCRDSGPHVRGCWVLDGVLGREG